MIIFLALVLIISDDSDWWGARSSFSYDTGR